MRPGLSWMVALIGAAAWLAMQADARAENDSSGLSDEEVEDQAFDFGEPAVDVAAVAAEDNEPGNLSIGAFVRSDWAVWTRRINDQPLAKARTTADVWARYRTERVRAVVSAHAERDLAYAQGSHDPATVDEYEQVVELREAFAEVSTTSLDLSAGRQIVSWGQGILLSPLSDLFPRDRREPGLTDPNDLLVPVTATRAALSRGSARLQVWVIHEARFGRRPPPLAPFSAIQGALPPIEATTLRYQHIPANDAFEVENTQLLARASLTGASDMGLYAASLLDQQGVIRLDNPPMPTSDGSQPFVVSHHRHSLVGIDGNSPWGKLVVRWEAALGLDRKFNTDFDPAAMTIGIDEADIVQLLGGITYTGDNDTRLIVEASYSRLFPPGELVLPFDAPRIAARWGRSFADGKLRFTATAQAVGVRLEYGWFGRAELRYAANENVQLEVGYATFRAGTRPGPLSALTRHDRAFARLRLDFLVR